MTATPTEEILRAVENLVTGYSNMDVLDSSKHTTRNGEPYMSARLYNYRYNKSTPFALYATECRRLGYEFSTEDNNFIIWVPVSEVLEKCAAVAKAPKFDKVIDSTGELVWKAREAHRMQGFERAYLIVHRDEYQLVGKGYRQGSFIPKAVPTGLRANDSTKAARSALIASFNRDYRPWLILCLNLQGLLENQYLGGVYERVDGFDERSQLTSLRKQALTQMRGLRSAIKIYKNRELANRKINAFFKAHKNKTHLELKDVIVDRCLEKIFNNTPKYMVIHPYSVVAKSLSK